jgi:hypothetical protein
MCVQFLVVKVTFEILRSFVFPRLETERYSQLLHAKKNAAVIRCARVANAGVFLREANRWRNLKCFGVMAQLRCGGGSRFFQDLKSLSMSGSSVFWRPWM